MADIAADRLNFTDQKPLEAMGEISGTEYGIGKTGSLKVPMKGLELAREVKNRFGLPFVTVYGSELYEDTPIVKAATCPGALRHLSPEISVTMRESTRQLRG